MKLINLENQYINITEQTKMDCDQMLKIFRQEQKNIKTL